MQAARPLLRQSRSAAAFIATALAIGFASSAQAQVEINTRSTIRDIVIGAPVTAQPTDFQEFACGTNGGPPSLLITSFADFAQCPAEESGLHEVQFRYDDLNHFLALARRDDLRANLFEGTKIGNYQILASVLVDDAGIVRGVRAVTDDRVSDRARRGAFGMTGFVHSLYGTSGWDCVDLPVNEGETPVGNSLVKEDCTKLTDDGFIMTTRARLFRRPGQSLINPANGLIRVGYYESTGRFEIFEADEAGNPIYGEIGATPDLPVVDAPVPADPTEAFLVGATIDCPGCDLSGADLARRDLAGADLAGANLSGAILHRALLGGANLNGADLTSANLNLADLKRATLVGADLTGAFFYRTDAAAVDLTDAILDGIEAENARFTSSDMAGVHWQRSFARGSNLAGADLTGAVLIGSVFVESDLQRASLVAADVTDATFYRARLRGVDFSQSAAVNTDFLEADLSETVFFEADLTNARLLRARSVEMDLTDATLVDTIMPDGAIAQ